MLHLISVINRLMTACLLIFISIFSVQAQTDRVQEAIVNLKSSDPDIRLKAIIDLNLMSDKRAVEPMLLLLDDPDEKVKDASIGAFLLYKDSRATEPLIKLLDNSSSDRNFRIVSVLGEIGDPRAVEPLIKLLENENSNFKVAVAESLSKLKDARAVEPLFRLIRTDMGSYFSNAIVWLGPVAVEPICQIIAESKEPERFYAVQILAQIADERAIPTLISLLGIGEAALGMSASDALAWRIGIPAIDSILAIVNDKNWQARFNAISALGRIKDERVIEPLLSAVNDENLSVRVKALEMLANFEGANIDDTLVAALNDPDLQFEAALILSQKKDIRALPYLIEAIKGKDLNKAGRAFTGLITIGKPAIDDLIAILLDKNKEYPEREIVYEREQKQREQQLAKQGIPYIRHLCGVDIPQPPIHDPRRRAAIALGVIRDPRAIEPLTKMLTDKSLLLRKDVAEALKILSNRLEPTNH